MKWNFLKNMKDKIIQKFIKKYIDKRLQKFAASSINIMIDLLSFYDKHKRPSQELSETHPNLTYFS